MLGNATGMITALWDCICVVTKHGDPAFNTVSGH